MLRFLRANNVWCVFHVFSLDPKCWEFQGKSAIGEVGVGYVMDKLANGTNVRVRTRQSFLFFFVTLACGLQVHNMMTWGMRWIYIFCVECRVRAFHERTTRTYVQIANAKKLSFFFLLMMLRLTTCTTTHPESWGVVHSPPKYCINKICVLPSSK